MASSRPDGGDAGFATPAAMAIALSLSVIVTAVVGLGVSELRHSRSDLARAKAEYALAGAQARAVMRLLTSSADGRQLWTVEGPGGPVLVMAEPETKKLSIVAAQKLGGQGYARLQLRDPPVWAQGLAHLRPDRRSQFLALPDLDASPAWRACARSVISPYGGAAELRLPKATLPSGGRVSWRIGQLWRIRVEDRDGWSDDRIVRFTGNGYRPAVVVTKAFSRTRQRGEACEAAIGVDAAS